MAIKANLVIDQGSDFIQDLQVTHANSASINLSGYTGSAMLRKTYTSEAQKTFTVTTNQNGIVQLRLNSANTESLQPGQYVWDCELTEINSGIVTRIVEGIVTVTPSVTR
jgi:hypothetical protein